MTATPTDRKAPQLTKAQLLERVAELEAQTEAQDRAESAPTETSLDVNVPLEFSLEPEAGEDTLVVKDPKTGVEIHITEIGMPQLKKLIQLRARATEVQTVIGNPKVRETDQADALEKLFTIFEDVRDIVFDAATIELVNRQGAAKQQKIIGRALSMAVGGGVSATGN